MVNKSLSFGKFRARTFGTAVRLGTLPLTDEKQRSDVYDRRTASFMAEHVTIECTTDFDSAVDKHQTGIAQF